ncbi:hypothetical protein D3C86_1770150 [compost metagenome]
MDLPLRLEQIRLEVLVLLVAAAQNRIESHFPQPQLSHHVAFFACALGIGFAECVAQAGVFRGAENHQDAFAITFDWRRAAFAFSHPYLAPSMLSGRTQRSNCSSLT